MEEGKKYIIGDFEYELKDEGQWGINCYATAYIGPTGPGSMTTVPCKVIIENEEKYVRNSQLSLLKNKNIEKIILKASESTLADMPTLKEIVNARDSIVSCNIDNCPKLEKVVIDEEIDIPVKFKTTHGHVVVEYHKGISNLDMEVAGDDIHAVFSDNVEEVGVIRGGHVTLGKGVKEIKALKKSDFGLKADTSVGEYELPTRIDFATAEPPIVGSVAPGSMTVTEIHVPAGALDAYMNHAQWGKAPYFVEEGGKTVDKYAAKHKARLKKLQKEREEASARAAEEAKADKIKAMGGMMHSTLATQRLAKWNPDKIVEWSDSIKVHVTVGCLVFDISIPKSAPIDIWDKITAQLEEIEAKLTK